jgi:hypothetical protein
VHHDHVSKLVEARVRDLREDYVYRAACLRGRRGDECGTPIVDSCGGREGCGAGKA